MKTLQVIGFIGFFAGAFSAQGASKAPYGHSLRLLISKEGLEAAQAGLFDRPEAGWAAHLKQEALCRASQAGADWILAENVSQATPKRLVIQLQPRLALESGKNFTTHELLASWKKLLSPRAPSVYRRLLSPLLRNGQWALLSQTPTRLEFESEVPLEPFALALCHPALGFEDMGPFASPNWTPNRFHARGRPFLSGIDVVTSQEAVSASTVDVRVGANGEAASMEGKALYATYLGFRPDAIEPSLQQALDQSSLRQEMLQRFVKKPAFAMTELLPSSWMAQRAVPSVEKASAKKPTGGQASLQLIFDESQQTHRAVAERLQLKMHDWGYSVELRAVPNKQLWARWQSGDYDFILHTILLPASAGASWELVKELGKNSENTWLTSEAAVAEAKARRSLLPLIPLYSQALRVTPSNQLRNFTFDAQGLPVFDDVVWLGD